ncbi:hypothetical protein SOMG_00735 [Schizosaccharomyces osmophilus]|uniref:Uncharacterized protein n=1 Tax=Schizosaccharomyces osmophilus TaxID=2545709 RepID=A0AAF0AUK5_9SCHI|nr:uncharacterized protein SOMG_00735 [Schizosaccharomyces osmophilus]WBW72586.1 hypothetical protein SOMG_00735 [Schizosaccharomyces osmophilus]
MTEKSHDFTESKKEMEFYNSDEIKEKKNKSETNLCSDMKSSKLDVRCNDFSVTSFEFHFYTRY